MPPIFLDFRITINPCELCNMLKNGKTQEIQMYSSIALI